MPKNKIKIKVLKIMTLLPHVYIQAIPPGENRKMQQTPGFFSSLVINKKLHFLDMTIQKSFLL
jgi:hypothetical protein